jgi:hypothetical protein
LLRRLRDLLKPDGRVLVEVGVHDGPPREVCLEVEGRLGPWFAWAAVGYRALPALAATSGYSVASLWGCSDRRFARLERAA